jgi:type IV fimbrial biogenesis protein FimT
MKRSSSPGVTLVELLVTLSVFAILLALAVPAFRELMLNSQRATQINAMMASLNLARAEAVKRGARTVVCISDGAASPDCAANPAGWEQGWIVFVDGNITGASDRTLDDAADANGNGQWDRGEDALLEIHGPLASGTTLRGNNNVIRRITFNRFSGTTGTLRHCDSRGAGGARGIIISNTGRARLTSDTDADGVEDDGEATPDNLTCP